MSEVYQALMQRIGYRFRRPEWLKQAMTHCSADVQHNERLEFLGDSILNMLIAEQLYQRFPDATEGELSRMRATLVREQTLAELAREFDLGRALILGLGEEKDGGRERASILSDAFEALLGAIYLDAQQFEDTREVLLRWYEQRLSKITPTSEQKDPKTRLQEWLQGNARPLPIYTVVQVDGQSHQQSFTVCCTVEGMKPATAVGSSRRRAEQAAATKILQHLE